MKAVIYARYSSDNQREESIEGQLRECTAYCKKNNITILRTYIDRAMSAKTDNRPDFQRMIKDSAKGLFDMVIVWKLDRFARNRYDSAHYKAQLRKYGVKVLSATENISEGPEGIILESIPSPSASGFGSLGVFSFSSFWGFSCLGCSGFASGFCSPAAFRRRRERECLVSAASAGASSGITGSSSGSSTIFSVL